MQVRGSILEALYYGFVWCAIGVFWGFTTGDYDDVVWWGIRGAILGLLYGLFKAGRAGNGAAAAAVKNPS